MIESVTFDERGAAAILDERARGSRINFSVNDLGSWVRSARLLTAPRRRAAPPSPRVRREPRSAAGSCEPAARGAPPLATARVVRHAGDHDGEHSVAMTSGAAST
jgi:hypothetical protein